MRERETVSVLRVREKKREREAIKTKSTVREQRNVEAYFKERERERCQAAALSQSKRFSSLRSRFGSPFSVLASLSFSKIFFSAFQDFFSSKVDPRVQRSTKASDSFQRRLNLKRKSVRRLPELSFTFWLKWTHVVFYL